MKKGIMIGRRLGVGLALDSWKIILVFLIETKDKFRPKLLLFEWNKPAKKTKKI